MFIAERLSEISSTFYIFLQVRNFVFLALRHNRVFPYFFSRARDEKLVPWSEKKTAREIRFEL